MLWIFVVFLMGCVFTAYGIWENKTKYSDRQFSTGRVIEHRFPKSIGYMVIVNRACGMIIPVVELTNKNGKVITIPLNTGIPKMYLKDYPEFDIGGKLAVSFFGDNPKECYLENHCMKQTVVKTSMCLFGGIILIMFAVVMILFYISV
ncbi:MAG: hypothetical protein HDT23_02685 [Ruminococcus sp.]|nr:hypothetical protein [Ruminococcus sp.]